MKCPQRGESSPADLKGLIIYHVEAGPCPEQELFAASRPVRQKPCRIPGHRSLSQPRSLARWHTVQREKPAELSGGAPSIPHWRGSGLRTQRRTIARARGARSYGACPPLQTSPTKQNIRRSIPGKARRSSPHTALLVSVPPLKSARRAQWPTPA
jgi:hypothetical protein